jgi:hypothetical protein
VRAYSPSSEEALRARDLLKGWRGDGLLTAEQYQRMEQETTCDLRRTNIFLRLALFFFTVIIVCAAVGLFVAVFFSHPGDEGIGIVLLISAAFAYAAAELAVSRGRLYRYGIEEALAVCSVGFLCAGMQMTFFTGLFSSKTPGRPEFLVPAAGAIASLWIWQRFGLPYAFLAAMIFTAWAPGFWTSSATGRHVIVAAFYLAGLGLVAAVRSRHRFTYLDRTYSIAEALLWLGIYLIINLRFSVLELFRRWGSSYSATAEFSKPFYWATWVMIWCLPAVVLARGLRRKDRFVIAVGAITAILTLITNKRYLGWQEHTWDLMLLGALLIGVAMVIRRWLADAPGGVRHGFTAQRLSEKDKSRMSVGATAIGVVAPEIVAPRPQAGTPEFHFGGGDSGGAGASSDF